MGPTSLDRFLKTKTITPVIALNPRRGEPPASTGTATQVNEYGVLLCPVGLPMRRYSLGPGGHHIYDSRIYDNCLVKRPTQRAGRGQ